MNKQILLADDDEVLSDLLADYLSGEGFDVVQALDGQEAVDKALKMQFNVIILDVMMPKLDGFEVLKEIRTQSKTPVIMLTARGEDIDRIVGLEMGADDYLPKPCNPRELLARIRAVLRRVNDSTAAPLDSIISNNDVTISIKDRTVKVTGVEVEVTAAEFNILHCLMASAGAVISKAELSTQALSKKLSQYDRSLDVHVSNLRKKLDPHHAQTSKIKTIRGVGYLFVSTL